MMSTETTPYHTKSSSELLLLAIMMLLAMARAHQNDTGPDAVTDPPDDMNDEVRCYGDYGCFKREDFVNKVFPYTPEDMGIKYATYTRRNRDTPVFIQANDTGKIRTANINSTGPFYFIAHGYLEKRNKTWILDMANALLNLQGNDGATVFVVDWWSASQFPYRNAATNVRLIGVMTAHFIHNIYQSLNLSHLDNFHFIGHNLGAHLGGYCGHALQKNFKLNLGRITGLDPAEEFFDEAQRVGATDLHLDRSDADYVDVIHADIRSDNDILSSSMVKSFLASYGMSQPIGHVDFYPNGGSDQPGCDKMPLPNIFSDKSWLESVLCSHMRSYEYFTESIASSCPFLSIQCDSYKAFLAGECSVCDTQHHCIPMGYHSHASIKRLRAGGNLDSNSEMRLYAMTGSSEPYCRVNYKVELAIRNSTQNRAIQTQYGEVVIALLDKNEVESNSYTLKENNVLSGEFKPGDINTKMVAMKDTGYPAESVVVDWYYTDYIGLVSSGLYIEYVKFTSFQYHNGKTITICTEMKKPVFTWMLNWLTTTYC